MPSDHAEIVPIRHGGFLHEGARLAYSDVGEGGRVVVLLHGLLLSRRMHEPLAGELARRGNRVVTLDLLGHGESERPVDMSRYSMPRFAEQVVALLDHLGVDEAVVGGTSLGANVSLEVACGAPARVRGLVVEMPVLDHALLAGALAFTPVALALTYATPAMRALAWGARRVPRILPFWVDVVLDVIRQDPQPSAAVIQGILFGRVAPPRQEREQIRQPTLVIGHHRDPIHPFSDAGMLAEELPNARLLEASSIVELRLFPRRLTGEIADFLDTCWAPRALRRQKGGAGNRGAAAAPSSGL
jgi:pimeloyl-ACP methyl ester carboxylesterase